MVCSLAGAFKGRIVNMSEESVKSVIVPSEVVDVDKLLVLVQSRPEIYDMSRKEHHNQDFMSKVWNEVGRELNVPGKLHPFFYCRIQTVYQAPECRAERVFSPHYDVIYVTHYAFI